jgi:hypothetical protein
MIQIQYLSHLKFKYHLHANILMKLEHWKVQPWCMLVAFYVWPWCALWSKLQHNGCMDFSTWVHYGCKDFSTWSKVHLNSFFLLNFQWQNHSKYNNSSTIGPKLQNHLNAHLFIEVFQWYIKGDKRCHGLGVDNMAKQKKLFPY